MNCTKYFYEDLGSFVGTVSNFKINRNCKSDIINHITFSLFILLTVGGVSAWLLENKNVFFIFVLLSLFHTLFWYSRYDSPTDTIELKEDFKNIVPDIFEEQIIGQEVTYPNSANPFMNVLVTEIKNNASRAPAASVMNPLVNMQIDDFFKTEFVNDPTDVFNKTQSQRQFYTTPSTTVPNDVDSYQNWLYRIPGKTCKEGGKEACAAQSGSAGGALPWLNSHN